MTFNIHSQTAGVINQVAGDQNVYGGQHGTIGPLDSARNAVRDLRRAVDTAQLDQETAEAAKAQVVQIDVEMRKERPDPTTVESRLSKLTALLKSAGSLAAAGATIVGPIQTLVTWLGGLGANIARMLV